MTSELSPARKATRERSEAEVLEVTKVKYQIKTLSSDFGSASGNLTDLSSTLEVGKTYRIILNVLSEQPAGDFKQVSLKDGSVVLGGLAWHDASDPYFRSMSSIREVVNGSITVAVVSNGSNIKGDGTVSETHMIIEELPNHEVVSIW